MASSSSISPFKFLWLLPRGQAVFSWAMVPECLLKVLSSHSFSFPFIPFHSFKLMFLICLRWKTGIHIHNSSECVVRLHQSPMVVNGFSREQSSRLRELVLGYLSPGFFFFFLSFVFLCSKLCSRGTEGWLLVRCHSFISYEKQLTMSVLLYNILNIKWKTHH